MTISARDRKLLWTRAGDECAFPGCSQTLTLSSGGGDSVLGEEVHIIPKSPPGPRGEFVARSEVLHRRQQISTEIIRKSIVPLDTLPKQGSRESACGIVWSSAASMTSRGWFVRSAAQSRKRRPEAVRHSGNHWNVRTSGVAGGAVCRADSSPAGEPADFRPRASEPCRESRRPANGCIKRPDIRQYLTRLPPTRF